MYTFNPIEVRDALVVGIKSIAEKEKFSKVVVGISGGKDSTITAALCVRALGHENVYGIMLPDGNQKDIEDSKLVCKTLNIPHTIINIHNMHKELLREINYANNFGNQDYAVINYSKESDINVAPRLRMTTLRYITQALGARLAGTGNLSEIVVGYCTKDGDTSCDFSVLGNLTSVEVVQIGLVMPELPSELVLKTPSDGLSGLSDEEKLGVLYSDIHDFIRNPKKLLDEKPEVYDKIVELKNKNTHKRLSPPYACVIADHIWRLYEK